MKKSITYFIVIFNILLLSNIVSSQENVVKTIPKGQSLQVSEIHNPNILTSLTSTIIFQETFESGATGWSTSGSWAIGTPTSGPNGGYNSSKCAATNLSGDYPNSANDWLISPNVTLTSVSSASQFTLRFMEWFSTESGYDYGYVKISTSGGSTWTSLSTRQGSSNWREFSIDLTSYSNRQIKIAFHFTSDGSVTFAGWYVDNVQITRDDPEPITATMKNLNSQNFPFVYMNIAVDTFGVGFPGLTQSNFTVYENNVLQTDYFQVVPPDTGAGVRLTDIVFLMDNSGSMSEEITAVRNNMIAFVNNLSTSGVNFALGLCRFGASQNSGYPIIEDNGILTTDANYFKNTVWARNGIDGGFEPGWDALYTSATSFNFRPGSQKIFILITDESVTGDGNRGQRSQQEAIQILQTNSVIAFALIDSTDSYARQDYGPVAQATGGQYFHIYRPFDAIFNYIGGLVSNTYVLSYRSSNPTFDGTTRNVQVIVTYRSNSDTATGTYVPGAAPSIQRTASTLALHNQPWAEGTTFNIEADIVDNVSPYVQSARLYYRRTGTTTYSSVAMTLRSGTTYRGVIPGSAVRTPGLDYYITATDGISTSSDPRTDPATNPYQFAILPNVAPAITHTPVTTLTPGSPITITATIIDNTNSLATARLYYRKTGQLLYRQVTMTNIGGNNYQAVIPASYVTEDGVDYYIYAADNFGVSSYYGTADIPIRLQNPLFYVSEKEAIINYFLGENFYVDAERNAQSYVNQVKNKITANTHTYKDIESVRRLTLLEDVTKTAYSSPLDANVQKIAEETANACQSFIITTVVGVIFGSFADALKPFIDLPIVGGIVRPIYETAVRLSNNFFTIGIEKIAGFAANKAADNAFYQLFSIHGLTLGTATLYANQVRDVVLQPPTLVMGELAETGLEDLSAKANFLKSKLAKFYMSLYENGITINIPGTSHITLLKGTVIFVQKGIDDASNYRFVEGTISQTERQIQTLAGQISSGNTSAYIKVKSSNDIADFIGKWGTIFLLGSVIIAIIAGIVFGVPIISLLGGISFWGLLSTISGWFTIARLVFYGTSIWVGSSHLLFDVPSQIESAHSKTFIRTGQLQKRLVSGQIADASLTSIPTEWVDSLSRAYNRLLSSLSDAKRMVRNGEWEQISEKLQLLGKQADSARVFESIVSNLLDVSYFNNNDTTTREIDSLYSYAYASIPTNQLCMAVTEFALTWAAATRPTDSRRDTIMMLLDSSISRIQYIPSILRSTFTRYDALGFRVPPIVAFSDARLEKTGSGYFLHAHIKNLSNTTVSNVVLTARDLSMKDIRLKPLSDTLVSSLPARSEKEFRWQIGRIDRNILTIEVVIRPLILPGNFQGATKILTEYVEADKSPAVPGPLGNQNIYAYPNPFNPESETANLRFKLGKDGNVTITVYDISNTKVKEVISSVAMSAGVEQSFTWDGRNESGNIVGNGVYFYVIESSSGERAVGKVAVLR